MTKRQKRELKKNLLAAAAAVAAILGIWWLGYSLIKDFMGLLR